MRSAASRGISSSLPAGDLGVRQGGGWGASMTASESLARLTQVPSSHSCSLHICRCPLPRGTHKRTGIPLCTGSKPGTFGKHQTGSGNANNTCTVMQAGKGQRAWPSPDGSPVRGQGSLWGCRHASESFPAGDAGCTAHPTDPHQCCLSLSSHFYKNKKKLLQVHKVRTKGVAHPRYSTSILYIILATQQDYFAGDDCEFHNRWTSRLFQVHLWQVALIKLLQKRKWLEKKRSVGNNNLLSFPFF